MAATSKTWLGNAEIINSVLQMTGFYFCGMFLRKDQMCFTYLFPLAPKGSRNAKVERENHPAVNVCV